LDYLLMPSQAPWSEEFGRWPILQLSLGLVNLWQIPVAIAPNFATIIAFRGLGGLSSAGGSVTLGMIADLWESDKQQYAVAFVVFSSVGGSILGPVVGGFVEAFLPWRCVHTSLSDPDHTDFPQMGHLDPAHLRRRYPTRSFLHRPGNSHDHHDEQDREEAEKRRQPQHLGSR